MWWLHLCIPLLRPRRLLLLSQISYSVTQIIRILIIRIHSGVIVTGGQVSQSDCYLRFRFYDFPKIGVFFSAPWSNSCDQFIKHLWWYPKKIDEECSSCLSSGIGRLNWPNCGLLPTSSQGLTQHLLGLGFLLCLLLLDHFYHPFISLIVSTLQMWGLLEEYQISNIDVEMRHGDLS